MIVYSPKKTSTNCNRGFDVLNTAKKKSINWNWHWATVFPWILTSKFLGCGHGSKVLRPVDPWFAYRSSCVYRPIFGAGVSYLDSYNARAVASGDQFSCILMCAKDIQSPLGVHYISEPEMTRPPLVSLGQQKNDLYPLASFKSTRLPSFNGYKSLHIKHYQHVNLNVSVLGINFKFSTSITLFLWLSTWIALLLRLLSINHSSHKWLSPSFNPGFLTLETGWPPEQPILDPNGI